jgi:hypothetical protein
VSACNVNPVSSGMCDQGTKGCDVRHDLTAKIPPPEKDYGRTQGPSKRDSLAQDSEPSAADALLLHALLREIVSDSLNDTGDPTRYSVDARLLTRASNLLITTRPTKAMYTGPNQRTVDVVAGLSMLGIFATIVGLVVLGVNL